MLPQIRNCLPSIAFYLPGVPEITMASGVASIAGSVFKAIAALPYAQKSSSCVCYASDTFFTFGICDLNLLFDNNGRPPYCNLINSLFTQQKTESIALASVGASLVLVSLYLMKIRKLQKMAEG